METIYTFASERWVQLLKSRDTDGCVALPRKTEGLVKN